MALLEDDSLLSERTVGSAGRHALWLLPAIKAHLLDSGLDISQIDLFAVSAGPGSFTGLRIGISTVKGLAWPLGKKTVGVSTLAALAMNVPYSTRPVCAVLDARKGELYAAVYDTSTGTAEAVMPDAAMTPDALFDELEKRGLSSPVFLGSGLEVYSKRIEEALPGALLAEGLPIVRASSVGRLGYVKRGEAAGPEALSPVYLRRSEAEIKFG